MQGVPSVIRLKQSKPNQDVRNLFDRKTYMKDNSEHDNLDPPSPRLQNINSHRIKKELLYDDEVQENKKLVSKKLSKIHDDENVQQAIDLRNQKQKHTDFFFKLAELKERIEVYNEVFRSKKPKFLHNDAKSMKQRMKEREMQRQADERYLSQDGNGSRLQSPFGSTNPKLPRQSSMTNGSNRKQRKSIAHTQSHQQVKHNIKDHEEPKKVENMNIIEAGEDEEQNSPTNKEKNLEQQDYLDLQNNLRIGSANASSKNSFQVQEKSNTIDNEKASLPKIVQTEQRLTTQHKQTMEKALETKKKQDQLTTNRLNAIEKKMPALNTSLSQQQFKPASKFSSTLYSTNNNHQTRTNNLGIQNINTNHLENMQGNASTGGLNRFINQSNNIMNRNRSQNNLKLFNQQEIDKNSLNYLYSGIGLFSYISILIQVMQNPLVNDQTSKKRKADQMSQSVFLQERDNSIKKEEQQHQNSLQDVYDYDQYDRNLSKKVTPFVNKSQAKIENIFFQNEEEKSSQRVQNQKVEIILDSDTEQDHKNALISKNKSISQQILERRAQNQTFNYSDYKKNLKDRQLCDSLLQDLAQISLDDSRLNIQETFQREIGQFLQDFTIKDDTVLIDNEKMSHPLTKSSLRKLEKGQWFNDEIINSYIELINHEVDKKISTPVYTQTRSTQNSSKIAPKPLILNTFFYTKLEQEAQKSSFSTRMLERFIKKQAENVQSCELIIIPINQVKMHWYLVVIDLVSQKYYIVYHPQIKAMTTVANLRLFFDTFLSQNRALDPSKWTFEVLEYVPKQNNGHDCGMCIYIVLQINQQLSDNKIEKFGYEINDETSVKMRMKIGVELLKFKLLA